MLESLSDVRRQAMENMRKIRERSGTLKGEEKSIKRQVCDLHALSVLCTQVETMFVVLL